MNAAPNEFDEKAAEWDDNPDRARRATAIAAAIAAELPHGTPLAAMEYGCGTGLLSFPLADRFSTITLIDSSNGMIEVLKKKIADRGVKNMEVLHIDLLESREMPPKTFSVLYSSMVLHHVRDTAAMFAAWHALLNRPGYLFVADLDSDGGLFHGPDFKGHNGFARNGLTEIARAAGFLSIRFRTVLEIRKFARDGIERSFPLFLMSAEKPGGSK